MVEKIMVKSADFVGLSKKKAQDLAEKKNVIFRLIRIDSEDFLAYPDDNRTDRVCVEIDNTVVTKAIMR